MLMSSSLAHLNTSTHTRHMNQQTYYTQQFLVAMPLIDDITFGASVIFVEEHNDDGAIGIINKPLNIELKDVFSHLDINATDNIAASHAVYMGGRLVKTRGLYCIAVA